MRFKDTPEDQGLARLILEAQREKFIRADESMCTDDACPSRFFCYRHERSGWGVLPDRQRYAEFDRRGEDSCEDFVKNE